MRGAYLMKRIIRSTRSIRSMRRYARLTLSSPESDARPNIVAAVSKMETVTMQVSKTFQPSCCV